MQKTHQIFLKELNRNKAQHHFCVIPAITPHGYLLFIKIFGFSFYMYL